MGRVRGFLVVEALAFWAASLIHTGLLLGGHQHQQAMIAEGVIGTVLTLGLLICILNPRSTPAVGSMVQVFALLGTLVGIFTMVVGVGPHTRLDVAIHFLFVALLVLGLTVAGAGVRDGRAVRY